MPAHHGPASGAPDGPLSPRARWARPSPAAAGAVLATGTLSVALAAAGREVLSWIALVLACAGWVVLAAGFAVRVARRSGDPVTPAAPPAVAATAVLGLRLSALGRQRLAAALLALGAVLWPVLLVTAVRRGRRRGTPGSMFLACAATEATAALGATLAAAWSVAWLAHTALVLFWLGLVLYCLALPRLDVRRLLTAAGDHWPAGGALALSALAGARLVTADGGGVYLWNGDDDGVLRAVTVALLVLTLAWCVVLAVTEAVRPRPHHDGRRWSTVFTLAMTATAALDVATAAGLPWAGHLGRVLVWVATAAWLLVAAGTVRSRVGVRSTGRR